MNENENYLNTKYSWMTQQKEHLSIPMTKIYLSITNILTKTKEINKILSIFSQLK